MTLNIPQPSKIPFLGNILDVDRNDPWGSFKKLADLYGPIYKLEILGRCIVVVTGASLAEEICDDRRFRKCINTPVMSDLRHAVNDALFTAFDNEENWGIAHRIMIPSVSSSSDEVRVRDLQDTVSELVAKWTSSPAQRVDVTEDMKRLNMQAVLSFFFNQHHNLLKGEGPAIVELLDQATWEAFTRSSRPSVFNWLYYDRVYDSYIREYRRLSADFIAAKRAEKTPKQDLLQALLTAKDPETGKSLDEEKIIDEIVTILVTATSTAGLMAFALYYLLNNPDIMTKARQEVDSVLGSNSQVTVEDLSRLKYLEAVIRESLRLSAAVPGFVREPLPSNDQSDILLADGKYQLPRDQSVIVLISAVNRDPDVFKDPDAFQPDRMLDEDYEKLPAGVKKGFGTGKRYCYGKRFALQLAMVMLISVLRNIDLQIADPDYKLKQSGREICANFLAPIGFFAVASPRNLADL